jgi:glycosyltransferase involved in cell wall biosynthesis
MISIAICSKDRFGELKRLLLRLTSLENEILKFNAEVLIIDNSDEVGTYDKLRKDFKHPYIKWIRNETPGLSLARNRALQSSAFDHVAFLDDDAIPLDSWLASICSAINESSPAIIAGPIQPVWPGTGVVPDWLPSELVGAFTVLDLGVENRSLAPWEYAYGANVVLNKNLAIQVGGFNPALGRNGQNLMSGEEIEIQDKIRRVNPVAIYASNARVLHYVDAERLNPNWILRRISFEGVEKNTDGLMIDDSDFQKYLEEQGGKEFYDSLITPKLEPKSVMVTALARKRIVNQLLYEQANSFTQFDSKFPRKLSRIHILETQAGHTNLLESLKNQEISIHFEDTNLWTASHSEVSILLEKWSHPISTTTFSSTIVFSTIDPWLFPHNFLHLRNFIEEHSDKKIVAILHRIPNEDSNVEAIRKLVHHNVSVVVFSNQLRSQLLSLGIESTFRSHPTTFDSALNRKLSTSLLANEYDTQIGVVGELRKPKRLDLGVEAVSILHRQFSQKDHFVLKVAGAAPSDFDLKFLGGSFIDKSLVFKRKPNSHRVIPNYDLARVIASSRIGFVFQDFEELSAASGILQLWINANKPVIVLEGTESAQIVEEFGLGIVADRDPRSIAHAVTTVLSSEWAINQNGRKRYLDSCDCSWDFLLD